MAKAASTARSETPIAPPEGAAVAPHVTADYSFTLQAVMDLTRTVASLVTQIDAMDRRIEKMADEVSKHGKWQFAANVVLLLALGVIGFIAKVMWDIAKVKFGMPS